MAWPTLGSRTAKMTRGAALCERHRIRCECALTKRQRFAETTSAAQPGSGSGSALGTVSKRTPVLVCVCCCLS